MKLFILWSVVGVLVLGACKNDDRGFVPLPPTEPITAPTYTTAERRCERRLGNRDEPMFSECVAELAAGRN